MTPQELRKRTAAFAVDVVRFADPLWEKRSTWFFADQLCRAATGLASNYRAATRGRSKREFIAKLGVALEEADESQGWLEILAATRKAPPLQVQPLLQESTELVAILTRSRETAIANLRVENQRTREPRT